MTRCPSANQLLAECFKKPIFEAKKTLKRIFMKSSDFDAVKNKKKGNKNSNYTNLLISNSIQENQEFNL